MSRHAITHHSAGISSLLGSLKNLRPLKTQHIDMFDALRGAKKLKAQQGVRHDILRTEQKAVESGEDLHLCDNDY
jgi:hypothetical protein